MITFEIIEIINDVLVLEEHNLELINFDALEEALVGSHDSKYSYFPKTGMTWSPSLGLNSGYWKFLIKSESGQYRQRLPYSSDTNVF